MSIEWKTVESPGYFGSSRDSSIAWWNEKYGEENWRIAWETKDQIIMNFDDVFWNIYVPGYAEYFRIHSDEARLITSAHSFTYDKEIITREEAFAPRALYEIPGKANQFHHVALNIALEWHLGFPFRGKRPLQVREPKYSAVVSENATVALLQAAHPVALAWKWSPGRIPTIRMDLVEKSIAGWWQPGSIEDFYQSTKVLQVKQFNQLSLELH